MGSFIIMPLSLGVGESIKGGWKGGRNERLRYWWDRYPVDPWIRPSRSIRRVGKEESNNSLH